MADRPLEQTPIRGVRVGRKLWTRVERKHGKGNVSARVRLLLEADVDGDLDDALAERERRRR